MKTSIVFTLRAGIRLLLWAGAAVALDPQVMAQVPDSILDEDPAPAAAPPIPDRVEGVNRAVFKFNDGFYRVAWRPLSRGYAAVVPRPARRGLGNFFRNLAYPTRFVGNVLSGQGGAALRETGRFLVNTTAGIGGFYAAADRLPELRAPTRDLGVAFANWGVGHGTYVVLPVVGPTSLRDGIGDVIGGVFLAPAQYLPEWEYRAIAGGLEAVNQSPDALRAYDTLKEGAIDPYVALRDAFTSRRSQQVRAQQISAGTARNPRVSP